MELGLRVDVDTCRGTAIGVPRLRHLLADHEVTASFFFSVGPDNMGRHVWRLLNPVFLKKMIRSRAPGLYGWDILLRGTFWPGRPIGPGATDIVRGISADGHEIGLHAWDHYRWQAHGLNMTGEEICQELLSAYNMLKNIIGRPPVSSAAPGWICNDTILEQKEKLPFTYNSDCRGTDIFSPVVKGNRLSTPQIPVTLPTYDEIIGNSGIGKDTYNTYMLSLLNRDKLNVLTVHAEVEGIVCWELFDDFLRKCRQQEIRILPLGNLLQHQHEIPRAAIFSGKMAGRQGRLALQKDVSAGRG